MQNPTSSTNINKNTLPRVIKLGIDVHASTYVVVIKVDSSAPARAKKMKPEKFLRWVHELRGQCEELHSCYEAGPFGYSLHRKLSAMGVNNYVIRPINWDTHGQKVKTDARDAYQMALALDGYLRGNDRSFTVVRVPSEAEEHKRSLTRLRQTFVKERARSAKRGLSMGLYYERPLPSGWWKPLNWAKLIEELDEFIILLLEPLRASCQHFDQLLKDVEAQMAQLEPQAQLPKGMGMVLYEQIEREICDWNRFENRTQISSYTGLCPSEDTSANRRFQGSINKHGNRRLRHMLVESVWLLIRWNPGYVAIAKWQSRLDSAKATKASRKKIVVAIARQFAVDWWRVRTGQVTAESLGLAMKIAN
ncbi:IS110 family transposase [Coraliomargarita sp. SDUM461004]|uniref:IS110 family transposase n=1 Tax=Thalassobacterium sedimentorum TaxID=3041258 RepID=A0ABU1ANS2_9BACT|nr:IS110 family transposase [Coraliomargarita sp. SDUM461004]MDQ8196440.1 IS110 family transposase [Coraliomargarita sp. SDUM461004]